MIWEGDNAVKTCRKIIGATNPFDSLPGTIRGDFCIDVGRNIIHGSDSVDAANKEIQLWFKSEEIVGWKAHGESWVYEKVVDGGNGEVVEAMMDSSPVFDPDFSNPNAHHLQHT